jgi:flagellar hook-associated protein 3 FlgL
LDNGTAPEIAKEVNTGFTLHTVKYNGDDGDLNFMVSKTLKIKGNASGDDVFTGAGLTDGVNVFDLLKELKDALEAPTLDSDWISGIKDNLVKGADQVEAAVVDLSVAYTRLESTENYWERFKLTVQEMLSDSEDVDLAQAIVELQHQETVYEAALAASAKLFNQSLIDFLR